MPRRWIVWLLTLAFLVLVFTHLAEVQHVVTTLLQGQVSWVLAAAGFQVLYYLVFALLYVSAFRTVEIPTRLSQILPLVSPRCSPTSSPRREG